jgi:hypothetical protein
LAQADHIVEGFFTGKVGQIEPMLDEVDAQYAFEVNRWTTIFPLRIVRFHHSTQISSRNEAVHGVMKFTAPCRSAVLFKSRALICCHG